MGDRAHQPSKVTRVRVLVVNDDSAIRQLVREVLSLEGYTTIEMAVNGQQALAVLRRSRVPYVVLLDDIMPVMDGLAVLEAVAATPALAARTAWVYLTARPHSLPLAFLRLLECFDAGLLPYPFGVDQLLQAVAAAATSLSVH